jgi:ppGpp synthetase/RelA/SpoT-type nucleotidyltranferase
VSNLTTSKLFHSSVLEGSDVFDEKNIFDKPSISQYKDWLKKIHKIEISDSTQTYYEAVVSKMLSEFSKSQYWESVRRKMSAINEQYFLDTNYYLFDHLKDGLLCVKSFDSFFLKTYRNNIINNSNWPNQPVNGWILPDNWFSKINDIVRTFYVVKYIDGVGYLADKLRQTAFDLSIPCRLDLEAKETGYYAAHFYVDFECEVPCENWDTRSEVISIEIQITTQLQEVIRSLLHKYYEERRCECTVSDVNWQWDYKSNEFATNYLGHILHYIEAMIIDVRDKK